MICRYCGEEMDEGANVCSACGKEIQTSDKKICPKCNEEMDAESKFCNKCGWSFEISEAPKKQCPNCGADLEPDAKFCVKCGHNLYEKKAKRRKPIALIVILIVAILIAAGGGIVYYMHQKAVKAAYEAEQEAERQRQELIVSYQKKAIDVNDAIEGAEKNFNLLSTMFTSAMTLDAGLLGPSYLVSYAEGLCAAELSDEKSRKRDIDSLFEELEAIGCNEEETQELKNAIEDLYYAYCERYELLVEMDFAIANFASKEENSSSDFNTKKNKVNEIVNSIEVDEDSEDSNEADGVEGEKNTL